ncbi:alpha/beta fold hydrolase [Streptomyces sp. NPDC051286]|uniref:alpha/beta fold hydrolase n=1 Tax=Streptomyces sp. NPDC051286 TaxID=3365647 RepID=UPI00378F7849
MFATDDSVDAATSAEAHAPDAAIWRRLASELSPRTCAAAIPTWITDFRLDLDAVDIPVLIVHGVCDQVLPVEITSLRLLDLLPKADYAAVEGAPHALTWTHADEVNGVLLDFLAN